MKTYMLIAPPHTRRTWFTLVGSVLLHGSIIALAAMWPVRYAPPETENVTILSDGPTENIQIMLPSAASSIQPPTPEDAPPPPPSVAGAADTPPPSEEPSIMIEPAPLMPATKTVESNTRPVRSSPMTAVRDERTQLGRPGDAGGARNVTGAVATGGRWTTPTPIYPSAMRLAHMQGNGSVRVTTDGTGRVVSVSVVQSTGSAMLDDNTSRFARGNWSGPPNATTTVPITYQLR